MRAGIYARISQDAAGTELGVGRQQKDCRAEAERRGWTVVEAYVDNDVSATRSKVRPEYERMKGDIRAGHVDAIVVWDIDRLTRTPRELEDIIDLADQHGLALANVGGDIDLGTSDGRMMARIKGTLARREVEQMSKRLKRRFQEKAELGEPHGYSPYGYERVDGRDVIVPEEAEVIREASRRVLASESLRSIVADFNARGIESPQAKEWSSTILRQILLRPSNAGLRQHRGKIIGRSTSEPIFDQATFEATVALLRDPSRRSNHAGPGFKYLLSGIAVCGLCGGTMRRQAGREVVSKRTGGSKRQPASYNCCECFKVRRAQLPVDELVEEVLIGRLAMADAIDLFAVNDSGAAKEAQAAIESIDAKLSTAADQFADDSITGEQLKRITARLRSERARAEAQLRSSRPSTTVADLTVGDVRENWSQATIGARREVVEQLVKVTVHPQGSGRGFDPSKVVITWK